MSPHKKKRGYNWTHKKSCKSKNPTKPKSKNPPKPYSSPKTVADWIRITNKGEKLALINQQYNDYPCGCWWNDYRWKLSRLLSTLRWMERNSIPPRDLVERMEKIHELLLKHNVFESHAYSL